MRLFSGNKRKVIVSRQKVDSFRASYPCSGLRSRSYWFEFDETGDLVDTDVPHHDDGSGAKALCDDAQAYLIEVTE